VNDVRKSSTLINEARERGARNDAEWRLKLYNLDDQATGDRQKLVAGLMESSRSEYDSVIKRFPNQLKTCLPYPAALATRLLSL
jgi:hypothetical protein